MELHALTGRRDISPREPSRARGIPRDYRLFLHRTHSPPEVVAVALETDDPACGLLRANAIRLTLRLGPFTLKLVEATHAYPRGSWSLLIPVGIGQTGPPLLPPRPGLAPALILYDLRFQLNQKQRATELGIRAKAEIPGRALDGARAGRVPSPDYS